MLLPLSAAGYQHTGGSEAILSLPRTRKPSRLIMSPRCLCTGQRQREQGGKSKTCSLNRDAAGCSYPLAGCSYPLAGCSYPLMGCSYPLAGCWAAPQFRWERGAATPNPHSLQPQEKGCHHGGPGDIAPRVSREPSSEEGTQGKGTKGKAKRWRGHSILTFDHRKAAALGCEQNKTAIAAAF